MIRKVYLYFKNSNLIQNLTLAILPSVLLLIIFYSNNLHLAYFDFSLLKYLIYFSFFSLFWIIFWKKTWFLYLSYLPLTSCLVFSSLIILTYLPYKIWYFYIFSFLLIFVIGYFKNIQHFLFLFISVIIFTQIIQGIYKWYKIEQKKFHILDNFSIYKYNQPLKKTYSVYYLLIDAYSSYQTLITEDRIDNSLFLIG